MEVRPLTAVALALALAILATPSLADAESVPAAGPAQAGVSLPDTVVVGTRVVPPFVILQDDGTYSGLTVQLWDRIARELDLSYRFQEMDIPGMLAGVEDGSFFTARIASSLTLTRLDSRVGGPQDLPHVRVGGLEASAAVDYLEEQGIRGTLFPSIQAGLQAVARDSIDAFVHDAPILRYYQREDFPKGVRVLPGTFLEQYYGIALPHESPYRNTINQVLLDHLASEDWERQRLRYLGAE